MSAIGRIVPAARHWLALAAIGLVLSSVAVPAQDAAAPAARDAAKDASKDAAKEAAKPAEPAPPALPAVPPPQYPGAQSLLDTWKGSLDSAELSLHNRMMNDDALAELRAQAKTVQEGASELIGKMSQALEVANARAAELAPDPKSTVPQSDDVRLERARLVAEISTRQGIVQQARLLNLRAAQLQDAVLDRRRHEFVSTVLTQSDSLLNPNFWVSLAAASPRAASRAWSLIADTTAQLTEKPLRLSLALAILWVSLVGYFLSPWRRWQARWTARSPEITDVSVARRVKSASAIMLTAMLFPAIPLIVFYVATSAVQILPSSALIILRAALAGLIFTTMLHRLTVALVAPGLPNWRMIQLEDSSANRLPAIFLSAGLVATVGLILHTGATAISAGAEVITANDGLIAMLLALHFMGALRVVASAGAEALPNDVQQMSFQHSAWRLLIPVGWIFASIAFLAPLVGYVPFARFLAHELFVVTAVLMAFILLRNLLEVVVSGTFDTGIVGYSLRRSAGLRSSAVRKLSVIAQAAVQLGLIAMCLFVVLVTWGLSTDDIVASLSTSLVSISVGSFTISPTSIAGSVAILVIGMLITRIAQRWLEHRFLPETNLDEGIRSSIKTGTGYLGIIVAVTIALSFVGLNLQNVAIIAGALSVGIGFGLQSIINNFVSGLILLVERPIKVGDRIEVGNRMGVVKRINVRATEIVTYDNLSVIVPNADLISGQVVNWMHESFSARLSVVVGTSYDADPDRVLAILLEIVKAHERVLPIPGPFAILSNFGADALEFKVFFHVGNIGVDAGVANEVRLEILKRFRREGIEIPYTQRDINLRDIGRIERAISELVGQAARPKPE